MKKLCFVYLIFFTSFLYANVGSITTLKGDVTITRDGNIFSAKLNEKVEKKDSIETKANSIAVITLVDKTQITIGKNSSVNIEDYLFDENDSKNSKANFNFFKGTFKSVTGKIGKLNPKKFKLKTKSASIGIRGTTILGNQERILVLEGSIFLTSNSNQVIVNAKQFSDTSINKKPTTPKEYTNNELDPLLKELYIKKKIITFTTENTKDKFNIINTSSNNGETFVNEDGSITYVVDENFVGKDIITIESNNNNLITTETVNINILKNQKFNLELTNINFNTANSIFSQSFQTNATQALNQANQINQNSNIPYSSMSINPTTWNYPSFGTNQNASLYYSNGNLIYNHQSSQKVFTSSSFSININPKFSKMRTIIKVGSTTYTYGDINDSSSYYFVNDDYFGMKGNTSDEWIQAVYDDINSDGEYESSDNSASWGYWQGYSGTTLNKGTWVAGNTTSLYTNTNLVFSGHIIGYVTNLSTNEQTSILFDNNNYINININIGSATTGSFGFNTQDNQNWQGSLISGTVVKSNTSTSSITTAASGTGASDTIDSSLSKVEGTFYGDGTTVESIGGTIILDTNANRATGSFIADKQ